MKLSAGITSISSLLLLSLIATTSRAQQSPTASTITAAQNPEPEPATKVGSNVRIVRLSQVQGDVKLDRATGHGFETAFANLPITQGQILETARGVAEVEFEDNSSLRITPDSHVEFPALQRDPSGVTINTIKLTRGTLYLSLAGTKGNQFTIQLGNRQIELAPSSHIRLDAGSATVKPTLAVFSGDAQVTDPSGSTITVGKKKTLTFESDASPVLTGKVEGGPFDNWDKHESDYHKARLQTASYGNPSYLYGINDLNYYGGFSNYAGCGSLWRPYFTGASWDPYANGIWAWYPGVGYSWVSPYPWGWTPFHSGSWQYCSTSGVWGWRPSNTWVGLANNPATTHPSCLHCPRSPLRPDPGKSTFTVTNTAPLRISRMSPDGSFVFHKDSAGMGVPREAFGKLNRLSQDVARHGSASAPVYNPSERGPDQAGQGPDNRTNSAGLPHSASRSGSESNSPGGWQGSRSDGGASRASSPSPSSGGGSYGGGSHTSSSPSPQRPSGR